MSARLNLPAPGVTRRGGRPPYREGGAASAIAVALDVAEGDEAVAVPAEWLAGDCVTVAVVHPAPVDHSAAAVLERRSIPGVVPHVPFAAPVAVGLGVGALAGVDLHVPVGLDRVGAELADVVLCVPQCPASLSAERPSGLPACVPGMGMAAMLTHSDLSNLSRRVHAASRAACTGTRCRPPAERGVRSEDPLPQSFRLVTAGCAVQSTCVHACCQSRHEGCGGTAAYCAAP